MDCWNGSADMYGVVMKTLYKVVLYKMLLTVKDVEMWILACFIFNMTTISEVFLSFEKLY